MITEQVSPVGLIGTHIPTTDQVQTMAMALRFSEDGTEGTERYGP